MERTTGGQLQRGWVCGLQRRQQHWKQRAPQPRSWPRWKGYQFSVGCSCVLWHRANDNIPPYYVSNFLYKCHGKHKSSDPPPPPHMPGENHWGQWGGTSAFGVFSSSNKFPPFVGLAKGDLDMLCLPKSLEWHFNRICIPQICKPTPPANSVSVCNGIHFQFFGIFATQSNYSTRASVQPGADPTRLHRKPLTGPMLHKSRSNKNYGNVGKRRAFSPQNPTPRENFGGVNG